MTRSDADRLIAMIDAMVEEPAEPVPTTQAVRPRGRPRLGSRLDARVPEDVIDQLCRIALSRGIPLAEVVRTALAKQAALGSVD